LSSVPVSIVYDYIIITTKCHPSDLPPLLLTLRTLITPDRSSILLLQNGLNIESPFTEAFPSTPILSGISMIGSRLTSPNSILHEDPDCWKVGALLHDIETLPPEVQRGAAQKFVDIYNSGLTDAIARNTGAGCILIADVVAARWRKLLWNGTYNTLCTLLRISVGELLSSPGKETLLEPSMNEMASIAKAAGYADAVTQETIDDMLTSTAADSPFRPSMLVDLEKGRPFELDVILGAPLKVAREMGVETPILDSVHNLLKVVLWKVTENRGIEN
jgi:2-dehydropantoate 2-reductase